MKRRGVECQEREEEGRKWEGRRRDMQKNQPANSWVQNWLMSVKGYFLEDKERLNCRMN